MTEDPSSTIEDPFSEIRPFSNSEAPEVIRRLARNEELAGTIARWKFPRLARISLGFALGLARSWLWILARRLSTVEDLQNVIAPNLSRMIKKTSRFSTSGMNELDFRLPRVYVGNHRDIVMDPAYANYALHRSGVRTLAVAIGDNLLSKPWISDLMRLNRSFIVKRNLQGPRALLAAAKLLSAYIRASVATGDNPIWIAHREGRAKDGRDLTEPAVIKMLTLSRDREESPESVLDTLKIVPLIISYELDPCDALKSAELSAGSGYVKSEFEDITSIATGIVGQKGRVHLHFGTPLPAHLSVAETVAAIDRQMVAHYRLYQTNIWAWQWLYGTPLPCEIPYDKGTISEAAFRARFEAIPEEHQRWFLTMYANPVNRRLEVAEERAGNDSTPGTQM
ncbi:MAG: 1-acyl-sn-glycerol-3-phosphate acyltransferase [Luminiphilus sp.]